MIGLGLALAFPLAPVAARAQSSGSADGQPAGQPTEQGRAPALQQVPQFVTLNRERLFLGSTYGQRILAQLEAERKRLAEETRQVEQELEAEELALTAARAILSPEEFRAKADAFDAKVVALRARAEAAEVRFVQMQEAERKHFFEQVGPVLWQLVLDLGAVAILEQSVIMLTTRNLDITDLAIARVDQVLGDGVEDAPGAPTGDAPGTVPAPEGD